MYTLAQAALATGKHKSTILRALQAKKIPAEKDVHGNYSIAPDDLHRVYALVGTDSAQQQSASIGTSAPPAPLRTDAEVLRTEAQLTSELAISEQKSEQINDLRSTIADLQKRLDQSELDRRKTDDNSAAQADRFTQLLAMEKKEVNQLRLENKKQSEKGEGGFLSRIFG